MKKVISLILLYSGFCFSQEIQTISFIAQGTNTPATITFTQSLNIPVNQNVRAYRLLGSDILTETLNFPIHYCNTAGALTDNQIRLSAVTVPNTYTITGVKIYSRVAGVFTADQNNKIGLYSYNAGTLTLIASGTTNWQGAANTFINIPFTNTLSINSGVYFVAAIYNNSAQTTAPSLASGTALNNAVMASPSLTNGAKLYSSLSTQNDLPSTINSTGLTASAAPLWFALY